MAEFDCTDALHNISTQSNRCLFVLANAECQSTGFIPYTRFVYCSVDGNLVWLALLVCLAFLATLFVALSTAADAFFCPSLSVIVSHLKLSHNIAGVTFLAFGNGAPDIFSSLAAVLNSNNSSPGLAFGALLGAGMFLSTIIVGSVTLMKPFDVMQRPLLRDLTFYLATIYWAFLILYRGRIRLVDALGFLILYVVYVFVVVIGRYVRKRMQAQARAKAEQRMGTPLDGQDLPNTEVESTSEEDRRRQDLFFSYGNRSVLTSYLVDEDVMNFDSVSLDNSVAGLTTDIKKPFGAMQEFLAAVTPISLEDYKSASLFGRIFMIVRVPVITVLTFTVPLVDEEKYNSNWSYILIIVQCCLCPLFALTAIQYTTFYIGGMVPIAVIVTVVALIVAIIAAVLCKTGEPPRFHKFLAYAGFVMAVLWIYCLAREVVNILTMFGIVLNISHEILGLTVLAWSNSLGDLVSDITVASQGYPRMAISACFGGPLFNMLVGIGLPFTVAIIQSGGGVIEVNTSPVAQVLCLSLGISLASSLIILPISKFHASRPYAIYLLILYGIFIVCAVLTELKLIPPMW